MKELVGIMMNTYEIRKSIEEIAGGPSISHSSIARLIIDWVNGRNISDISSRIFPNDEQAIQKTTKALYKVIANAATWGLAALQKMPTSGIDWESLSDLEKRKIANLPAYLHYGVNTDEGVLMRKIMFQGVLQIILDYFLNKKLALIIYLMSQRQIYRIGCKGKMKQYGTNLHQVKVDCQVENTRKYGKS